jgi:hypothetical protein
VCVVVEGGETYGIKVSEFVLIVKPCALMVHLDMCINLMCGRIHSVRSALTLLMYAALSY